MATEITSEQVLQYLKLDPAGLEPDDTFLMSTVVAGVNALVPNTVPRVRELVAAGQQWPPDVIEGALMQAARLWQRRRTPGSIGSYADTTGTAQFIARWDPDIERLLQHGKWAPPAFG